MPDVSLCSENAVIKTPFLLWLFGLSGSGKTTLANAVAAWSDSMNIQHCVLDGDNIRKGLNKDLGLSPEDRRENIRRSAELAKLLSDSGISVIAAFITPYKESRRYIRELLRGKNYYECYVKCPLEICERRDPKGLYRNARLGKIRNMTGLSAPFEEPDSPDLIVETSLLTSEESVNKIINFLKSGLNKHSRQ
jgi:adenylylsulfate kinase